jgi:hypothetical protein
MIKNIFKKTEKYFQEGTVEQFRIHKILLFSNSFLLLVLTSEVYLIVKDIEIPTFIHVIEFIFGIIFLIELIFYLLHVYIPNKVFFKPRIVLNTLVVVSLLAPTLFGNLAFLRLIKSVKIIKVFIYGRKVKNDLKKKKDL